MPYHPQHVDATVDAAHAHLVLGSGSEHSLNGAPAEAALREVPTQQFLRRLVHVVQLLREILQHRDECANNTSCKVTKLEIKHLLAPLLALFALFALLALFALVRCADLDWSCRGYCGCWYQRRAALCELFKPLLQLPTQLSVKRTQLALQLFDHSLRVQSRTPVHPELHLLDPLRQFTDRARQRLVQDQI
eukprot:scaffold13687_cov63-Phaeocystis_antarctica.AAC.3